MNESTQTGVAMAAIAAICTIAGALVSWLKDRDKLQNSAEIVALKAQNTVQGGQIATQGQQIAALTAAQLACEKMHRECEESNRTMTTRIGDIEKAVAAKNGRAESL